MNGEITNAYNILNGKSELKNTGAYGKILLQWILGKNGRKEWTGCIGLRVGTNGGLLRTG